MVRPFARAVLAALLLILCTVPAVLGHAEFVGGTPSDGEVVTTPPRVIIAEFSQDLDPSRTSLDLRSSSGASIAKGGELGANAREFRLDVPALEPGEYEVRWTTFSAEDNELARGSYGFTVAEPPPTPPPTRTPTPTPTAAPTPTPVPTALATASPTPTAPPTPTASPTPTPAATTPTPAATPAASPTDVEPAASTDTTVLIPILVALAVVVAFVIMRLRQGPR